MGSLVAMMVSAARPAASYHSSCCFAVLCFEVAVLKSSVHCFAVLLLRWSTAATALPHCSCFVVLLVLCRSLLLLQYCYRFCSTTASLACVLHHCFVMPQVGIAGS